MSDEQQITDPKKIAAYVKSAKGLYDLDAGVNAIEVADPPVVIATPSGAKVMAGLPVDDEDRWESLADGSWTRFP